MDKTIDSRDLDQLKDLGAGRPAPEVVARLYQQAFCDFGVLALWSSRPATRSDGRRCACDHAQLAGRGRS
jgi:hypothetical protein